MAFTKAHGLVIAQNGYIQNAIVEQFTDSAEGNLTLTTSDIGRIWYNATIKKFKVVVSDGAGGVTLMILNATSAGDIQGEVDKIEAAAGFNADGTFSSFSGTNYLDSATTLKGADIALDTAIKSATTAGSDVQTEVNTLETTLGTKGDGTGNTWTSTNIIGGSDSYFTAINKLDTGEKNIQDELDAAESAVGLNADGSFAAWTGTNYLNSATTVKGGITALDSQLKTTNTNVTNAQNELNDAESAIGLAIDGTFVAWSGTNYIDGATSIKGGSTLLDTQLKLTDTKAVNAQAELDTLEATLGANAAGTLNAWSGTNYIDASTTFKGAITTLDGQAKTNATAISTEVTDRGTAVGAVQDEVDAIENAAGLNANGTYSANTSANYIGSASSLKDADNKLDTALKSLSDTVSTMGGTTITNLQTEVDNIEAAVGLSSTGTLSAWSATNYLNSATTFKGAMTALDGQLHSTDVVAQAALPTTGGTMTGNIDMNTHKMINVGAPVDATDAATKAYVDAMAQGLSPKTAVVAATTEDITLSAAQVIDGISCLAGDRVLVKDQTDPKENGIYVVASGAWTRATDMDGSPATETKQGTYVYVSGGNTQEATGWAISNTNPVTIGTTDLAWVQFSSAGLLVAGIGLSKAGNVLNIGLGAGIKELPNDEVGIDIATNSGLFLTVDGSTASTSSAAKIKLLLDGNSLQLGANGLSVAGGATSAIQDELNALELAMGANTDGTYKSFTTTNYLNASTTVMGALTLLDTKAKNLQDELDAAETGVGLAGDGTFGGWVATNYLNSATTIKAGVAAVDAAAGNIQAELDAAESAIGLATDGTFVAWTGTNYLNSAASIKAGITALDTKTKSVQDELDASQTALGLAADGTLSAWTSTTYLNSATTFKGAITALDTAFGNYVSKTAYNAKLFNYKSAVAEGGDGPATQHVVAHNLATNLIDVMVWVKGDDGMYRNDIVSVTIDSSNQITLDLTESRDVRVTVDSNVSLS